MRTAGPVSPADHRSLPPSVGLRGYARGVLTLLLITGLATWLYFQGIAPHARVFRTDTSGFHSDLYPPWYAAHQWRRTGADPYSPEITADIQQGIYGRKAGPGMDEQRFAYPAFVVLLLAPLASVPFNVVNTAFFFVVLLAAALGAAAWLRAFVPEARAPSVVLVVALVLGFLPIVQGAFLRQLGLLVFCALGLASLNLSRKRLTFAGIFLALAFAKPHFAAPMAAWLLVWSLRDWRSRRGLVLGFAGTLAGMLLVAELALPGWWRGWFHTLGAYTSYAGAEPLLFAVLGRTGATIALAAGALALALLGWTVARQPSSSSQVHLVSAATLAAALLVVPTWTFHNQIFLLPAILGTATALRRPLGPAAAALLAVAGLLLFWDRLAATLVVAAWVSGDGVPQTILEAPLYSTFLLPWVVVAMVAMALLRGTRATAP